MAKKKPVTIMSYSEVAIPHLEKAVERNRKTMDRLVTRLVKDVEKGRGLLIFGSGHSAIFPLELYHRAGGASFVIPIVADYLLPTAGPPVVRILERTPGTGSVLLNRVEPKPGEMIWIASQSGINAAVVDFALEAKKRGLLVVAFTSIPHSRSVQSRHSSGLRLFEVSDLVIDLGGYPGDACVSISKDVSAGPLSTLTAVMLGHSILVATGAKLERRGVRCIYTSVNTPEGEERNQKLERVAKKRDSLLR